MQKESIAMTAAALHANNYKSAKKKVSFVEKYIEAFKENRATIVGGVVAMNGAASLYPLYKSLSK